MKTIKNKNLSKIRFAKGINVIDSIQKTFGVKMLKDDKQRLRFAWDVSELNDDYIDESDENFIVGIVEKSNFLEDVITIDNIKGEYQLKTIDGAINLQDISGTCDVEFDGNIAFDGPVLKVHPIAVAQSFCNETLIGTWAQLILKAGLRDQNADLPLEQVLVAFLMALTKEAVNNIAWNGDTTSLNDNLNIFDGFVKLLDAGATAVPSAEVSITASNAEAILLTMYNSIPEALWSSGYNLQLIASRTTVEKYLQNIWATKDYNGLINREDLEDGSIKADVVTTPLSIRSIPQLAGTDKVYLVIPELMFIGTDEESDMNNGFKMIYNEYGGKDQLEMVLKFRLGVQLARPELFRKLVLGAS